MNTYLIYLIDLIYRLNWSITLKIVREDDLYIEWSYSAFSLAGAVIGRIGDDALNLLLHM